MPDAPVLDAATALARVRAWLNDPAVEPEAEPDLFVYPPSKLAWRLNVLKPHFVEILLDAVDGQVLLRRSNVHDVCTVALTVMDKDGLPLPSATGQYYVGATQDWSLTLDANGQATDATSATGTSYCRAVIEGTRARVRDADNDATASIVQDTPTFTTVNGQTYSQTIALNNSSGVNSSEGGVAFREVMRAWNYVYSNYGYDRARHVLRGRRHRPKLRRQQHLPPQWPGGDGQRPALVERSLRRHYAPRIRPRRAVRRLRRMGPAQRVQLLQSRRHGQRLQPRRLHRGLGRVLPGHGLPPHQQ